MQRTKRNAEYNKINPAAHCGKIVNQINKTDMKKTISILSMVVLALASQAQGIYNSDARIVSQSGTYWVISGGNITLNSASATNLASVANLKIESGATLTLTSASFLTVAGALQNSGTLAGPSGSTVTLSGSSAQAITGAGASTFGNLTLNNTNGLTLTDAGITVNGALDFTSGILTTGANTATIGSTGSITNASSAKYVDGKLAHTFAATGTKTFPVGKGGNYRPVTFNYTALTGTSVVTAEQTESGMTGTMPANTVLLTTGRYWTISQTGGTNLQYFVSLDATDYTATNTVKLLKKDGTILSYATTTPNYTNAAALTSLGDFALGELTCLLSTGPAPKVADLVVTATAGATIKWYTAETAGDLLASSTPLTTATDYWASQTVNGVESTGRFKVTATINDCYITITTVAAGSINATTASSGGTISNNCGGTVTASGVCWSTTTGPIATGNHTSDGATSGSFTSSITGLTLGATYYVRAYATNDSGTAYGDEVSFTTATPVLPSVGQSYQGGVLAYVLVSGDPGYSASVQHGLIAAPSDQSTGSSAEWGCYGTTISGAVGTAIGTGKQNTIDIMAAETGCATAGIAARLCGDLVLGGFSDWYLPSRDELRKLCLNKTAIGGFAADTYWSSSQGDANSAWYNYFPNDYQVSNIKSGAHYVRAVRAF
jgi:hypothetical protein